MKEFWNSLPPIFRNFYFIVTVVFLIWVLFFDRSDIITHFKLMREIKSLEEQKDYYSDKIIEVEREREELMSDNDKLEKFAREKYLMKKENEDLYIIVEKEEEAKDE